MRSAWFKAFVPLALAAVVAVLLSVSPARAGNDGVVPQHDRPQPNGFRPEARIDEKIDAQVPMDLVLRDENDQPITLGDAMAGRPTILVPVYYRCPMLCTKILNGVLEACRQMPMNFSAGQQFTVVAVSMDPKEHAALAREKKKAYLEGDPKTGQPGYGRPGAESGWRFLTGGNKETIAALLDTVGYKFEFDKMMKEYNHPSGIVILSPQGKVKRYFYGIGYDGEFEIPEGDATWPNGKKPELTESELRDRKSGERTFTHPTTTLRLSLIEAADGRGGSLLDKLTLLCYRYDALHQGYALKILWVVRIGGIITLAALVTAVVWMLRRDRRTRAAIGAATGTATATTPEQSNGALPAGGTA
jgi:protein SCO1/2